jgi:hypothetical protein
MNISAANEIINSGARFDVAVAGVRQKVHAFRAVDVVARTCDVVVGSLVAMRFESFPIASLSLDGTAVATRLNFTKYPALFG